jgi:hypothetical protein
LHLALSQQLARLRRFKQELTCASACGPEADPPRLVTAKALPDARNALKRQELSGERGILGADVAETLNNMRAAEEFCPQARARRPA